MCNKICHRDMRNVAAALRYANDTRSLLLINRSISRSLLTFMRNVDAALRYANDTRSIFPLH
jgi:hypothetical protein